MTFNDKILNYHLNSYNSLFKDYVVTKELLYSQIRDIEELKKVSKDKIKELFIEVLIWRTVFFMSIALFCMFYDFKTKYRI